MGTLNKLFNTLRSTRTNQDAADELAFHLENRIQANLQAGMSEEEARFAAQRQIGNLTRLQEDAFEVDVIRWLDALKRDTKLALRTMHKSPLFSAIAILSLTLGIGANTMVFTVMKHLLLDSLPVPNANRLVILHSNGRQEGHTSDDGMHSSFSYPQYKDLRAATGSVFTDVLARLAARVTLERNHSAELVSAELVSGNYFSVLGVKPWRGRLLAESDNRLKGGHPVAVLGHGAWQRLFGSDPTILNQSVLINGHSYVVVGIAPPGFYGIRIDSPPDVYVPMMMKAQITPTWDALENRLDHWASLVAELKPGVSIDQARRALSVLYPPIRDLDYQSIRNPSAEFRREFSKSYVSLTSGVQGYADVRSALEKPLRFLAVMVSIVLLITIINVANLLISRSAARERDFAVRLSIGAGKRAIVRQLLVESLLLACVGGVLGIVLAYVATPVALKLLSTELSQSSIDAHPDLAVLAVTASLTLLSAVAFGLFPALQSAGTDPAVALKSEGATSHSGGHLWLRRILVGGQIAFSMLLLTAALLFTKSLNNLRHLDPGFPIEHLITFKLDPSGAGYSQERVRTFSEALLNRLRLVHGVRQATVATSPVFENNEWGNDVTVEGSPQLGSDAAHALKNLVSPGYFETFQLPLLQGRKLEERDSRSKVIVINAAFAKHFLPGQNPIGRHVEFSTGNVKPSWTIVGVVADSQHTSLRGKIEPFTWTPYLTEGKLRELTYYVRTDGNEATAMQQIRRTIQEADSTLPIYDFYPLEQVVSNGLFAERGLAAISNVFAGLAVALAAIGLYGVVNYSVARRRREFGIRVAVGATPSNVMFLVLRETALIGIVGLACAFPLILSGAGLIRSTLYGIEPNNPTVLTISALGLLVIALAAGFFPARDAAVTDPNLALRSS